jgi:protein gp37
VAASEVGDTKIAWTNKSWNPVTGCTKASAGCVNCYAERLARRLQRMNQKYENGFRLTLQPQSLEEPLRWRDPRHVFVCSMGDLFHRDVDVSYISQVFDIIRRCPQHTFQILTKRIERMASVAADLGLPANVWAGVTVERNDYAWRADVLRSIGASVRFISAEPLLGPLPDLELDGIDQLIVGGESGPGARPMDLSWAGELRDRCLEADIAFFFKQVGGVNKKKAGHLLDGCEWREFPQLRRAVG